MATASQIDMLMQVTSAFKSWSFQKLGYLDYLVNGRPVKFRHIELTSSNRHMIDLLELRLMSAMGPYSHPDDPYGK